MRSSKLIFSAMMKWCVLIAALLYGQSIKAQSLNMNNDNFIVHHVTSGETLYSISKRYNTTVDKILSFNPSILDNRIEIGSDIRIPIESNQSKKAEEKQAILYEVQKKETLYSISKRYNIDVETLMKWNGLADPSIQEGQEIIVGYKSSDLKVSQPTIGVRPDKAPESHGIETQPANSIEAKPNAAEQSASSGENNQSLSTLESDSMRIDEKGTATWVKSGEDDGNFYALHPYAAKGTQIMVRNSMTRKSVIVKVIGKLPATEENENVLIKVSASAAKQLGVLDDKFIAELSYMNMMRENFESIDR